MPTHSRTALAALSTIAALVLLASMSNAAFHDVSQAWDSGYYHLPFAARLGGILAESDYAFGAENRARFAGFPLLGELLQGVFWRIFGRIQAANFVALLSVPLLALSVRKLAREAATPHPGASWGTLVLGFLGIPLVMMHATSTYVDLPASAALTAALARAILLPAARLLRPAEVARISLLLAISANMRLQHLPLAAFVHGLLAARFLACERGRTWRPVVVGLAFVPLVFFTPLKNLLLHGNPVFPVEITIFGRTLPYVETRYASSPDWLVHAPQPLRWLMSILEVGLPPLGDPKRYSIDQWTPPRHPGYRMGGSLGAGIVLSFGLFVYGAWRHRARRRICLAFGAFTLLTACMPQSHELRYTLYWPLTLSTLAILLGYRHLPRMTGVLCIALPCVVALATGGAWLAPGGSTLPELIARKVDQARIDRVPEGGTLCIFQPPWTFLYAAKLHGRHYSVREDDGDGSCTSTAVRSASTRTASSSLR